MLFTRFLLLFIIISLSGLQKSYGYRILGIFPLHVKSHMMMFERLMKGLVKRGHQVDVISTLPQKKPYPNYTDIEVPLSMPNFINNMDHSIAHEMRHNSLQTCITMVGNDPCQIVLSHPKVQKLIKTPPTDPPYDAVIVEILGAHCMIAFGYHLQVPAIGLSASILPPWVMDILGNPANLAFVPNMRQEYVKNMNFWNRLKNVVDTAYNKVYFNYYTSIQTDLIRKHFGPDAPSVRELERDLALILVNSHHSMSGVKPTTPAHKEVGGLHIHDDDDVEISAEDKKWLDESKSGFIYFTLGSMVNIESFPRKTIKDIYKSFEKIAPVRVLMKVPQPNLLPPGLPKNVRTFKWISQFKVLKHTNIRGFITHGGLMSTQEAVTCGVPMIGIPLLYDQFMNIDQYAERNIAIRLDFDDLTEYNLDMALKSILHDRLYSEAVKNISKKFLDRPLSPLDEACYWVEYIIRYGKKALRSPAMDLPWWQIELLDVYFTLLTLSIIVISILIYLVQYFIKICHKNPVNVDELKKYK